MFEKMKVSLGGRWRGCVDNSFLEARVKGMKRRFLACFEVLHLVHYGTKVDLHIPYAFSPSPQSIMARARSIHPFLLSFHIFLRRFCLAKEQ